MKTISAIMGAVLFMLSAGKSLAQEVKTIILNRGQLSTLRSSNPNLLKGIDLNEKQILVLKQDSYHQILDIKVFDEHDLAGNHLDGHGDEN